MFYIATPNYEIGKLRSSQPNFPQFESLQIRDWRFFRYPKPSIYGFCGSSIVKCSVGIWLCVSQLALELYFSPCSTRPNILLLRNGKKTPILDSGSLKIGRSCSPLIVKYRVGHYPCLSVCLAQSLSNTTSS